QGLLAFSRRLRRRFAGCGFLHFLHGLLQCASSLALRVTLPHGLRQFGKITTQRFLLATQLLQLPAALFFCKLLLTPCQFPLCSRQSLLTFGKLSEPVEGFVVTCLLVASQLLRQLVAVFQLTQLHFKQLAKLFTLAALATTAGA